MKKASIIQQGKLKCKSDRILSFSHIVTLLLHLQRESKFEREVEGSIEKNV